MINKTQLVEKLAEGTELPKTTCAKVIDEFMTVVKDAVKTGDKVQLVGFGTFERGDRAAREGKNPQTGEPMTIPASHVAKFKPGKTFKDYINE